MLGFKSYVEAIKFIWKHKMWVYFIFPIMIFVGIYYLGYQFENLRHSAKTMDSDKTIVKLWSAFLSGIFWILAYVIFNFMRYILIIIISPILSIVSEKVEQIITGNKYKFNLKQLIRDIKRTINIAIRNIFWEFGIILTFLILITLIGKIVGLPAEVVSGAKWFFGMVVAFYYYGFGFIDFMNERRRLNIKESISFGRKHRGFAIALGLVFTILFHYTNKYFTQVGSQLEGTTFFFIIMASSIIMAIIPILTIVAATLGVHEIIDLNDNEFAQKKQLKNTIKTDD